MRLVLLGAPGSGKGTQAKALSERLGIFHLSTGDILRGEIKADTILGKHARSYMDMGQLVPDSLILDVVKNSLVDLGKNNGFILDGFPRTVPQAEGLETLAEELDMPLVAVVNIDVDSESIVKRLSARSTCSVCGTIYNDVTKPSKRLGLCDLDNGLLYRRPDDSEGVVRNRLKVYYQQTKPLEEYYTSRGLLVQVDGNGSVEGILARILKALESAKKKDDRIEIKARTGKNPRVVPCCG